MRARGLIGVGLALLLGCNPTPPPPAVAPAPVPTAGEPVAPPPEPYQLDPTQHHIPDTPAAGRLDGAAFAPTATLTGTVLTFHTPAEGHTPERSLTVSLPATGSGKRVVKPDQPGGADVPEVMVSAPPAEIKPGADAGLRAYPNGYSLTLELDPPASGAVRGRLYLALPDAGKSYLAGTFTAAVQRGPDDRPGAADVPFVEGKLTLAAGLAGGVDVGYVGASDGQVVSDLISMAPPPPGVAIAARPEPMPQQQRSTGLIRTAGGEWRYEHTRLPAGRYLVTARIKNGPAAWRWVDVPADGKVDAPLTLDPAATGSVTVKVPADATAVVQLLPADDRPASSIPDNALAFALQYEGTPKAGTLKFDQVAVGTYRVVGGGRSGTVTVAAGKAAVVELK